MDDLEEAELEGKVRKILTQYGGEIAANSVFFRGIRGGFSGSEVYEVNPESGTSYFLKGWPQEGPDLPRLRLIHEFLGNLAKLQRNEKSLQLPEFPEPLKNRFGSTITEEGGILWELTPKVSGTAKTPQEIGQPAAVSAMQALARVHLALDFLAPSWPQDFKSRFGASPGLAKRRQMLESIAAERLQLTNRVASSPLPEALRSKCIQIVTTALPAAIDLTRAPDWHRAELPLQPVLRDVWYAHVLFQEAQVAGIIDFGSTGHDSVATDLARLLRSWFASHEADFAFALDAYHQIRPLSPAERSAFTWFDRTSRVLSAFQWIEWLATEERQFEDWSAVADRLDFVLARLPKVVW